MKLKGHLGTRLLTEQEMYMRVISTHWERMNRLMGVKNSQKVMQPMIDFVMPDGSKNFYITGTVHDLINHISLKKPYQYTMFKQIADGKRTYLLPNNNVIRINKKGDELFLGHFWIEQGIAVQWNFWRVDLVTGLSVMDRQRALEKETEVHIRQFTETIDVSEHLVVALMCFVFLSETEERVLKPNQRVGTRKAGKVLNDSPITYTIVNSTWNVRLVSTDEFKVKGYFAIRWTGQGRVIPRVVFVEPYVKEGYSIEPKKEKVDI